ncbi:MAG: carbamoyltransferase HypF [Acidobacteriota bacterium]
MLSARLIQVRGVVQGVGFRPCIYRLANAHALTGWVLNGEGGVEIHVEGPEQQLEAFVRSLRNHPPAAASITGIQVRSRKLQGFRNFAIRESQAHCRPTTRISPDLPVCPACLQELMEPRDRRHAYPYINCTECGPRYSIILGLPYDRPQTTMRAWTLCSDCARQYQDPDDRRFHAQPVACPLCGPRYRLQIGRQVVLENEGAILEAARLLKRGPILAVKGLGGYHLACDARNAQSVMTLRNRKFRKEKPFALMAESLSEAESVVELDSAGRALLASPARPIVLAPAKVQLAGVAPETGELGLMLPYTPLHHLLFAHGAPKILVMTSANRSNEPIAYRDEEALGQLAELADGFLIGERAIARRVEDSVARVGVFGPVVLRRGRGYAPAAVATIPVRRPVLAVGADLKNTITLVVEGQAFVSQHIGDLKHRQAFVAFQETIRDLMDMYAVPWDDVLVAHDGHPQYLSTTHALTLFGRQKQSVQHHRAHLASVLAERGQWQKRVVGVSFDGTGYGDDGAIWGGEIFIGSVEEGFQRVAHLRYASLPGGDAAAQHPVQAAAGFLSQLDDLPDLAAMPFNFPARYGQALQLVQKGVRSFPTSSMGRLFDTAAALTGFVRPLTFEGQAAIWLENLARTAPSLEPYPFPFEGNDLDFRPLLRAVVRDRLAGRDPREIARAFHLGIACGLGAALRTLSFRHEIDTIVLSGGVFQNSLLMEDLKRLLESTPLQVWTNHAVPPNDGGVSLGQAALAVFAAGVAIPQDRDAAQKPR